MDQFFKTCHNYSTEMLCLFRICGVWCDHEIGTHGNEIAMFLTHHALIICRNNAKISKIHDQHLI